MSGSHFASRFRPQTYDGQSITHSSKDGRGSVSDWRLRLTASDNTGGRHVPLMHAAERGATQTSEDTHGDEVDDEEVSAETQNKRQRRFLYASSSRAQTPRHWRPNNKNTHSNECSFIGRFTTTPIVTAPALSSSSPSPSTARLLHAQEDEGEEQPEIHSRFAPRPWRSRLGTHTYTHKDTSVNHYQAWTRPVTSTPQQRQQHSYTNAHTHSTIVAVGPSSSVQNSSSLAAATTMGTTTTSAPASSSGFTPRFRYGGVGQRARTLYNLRDPKEREEDVASNKPLDKGGRWQLPSVLTTHRVEPLVESAPPWRHHHQRPFSSEKEVTTTSESTATFAPRPAWGSTTSGAITTPRFVPHTSTPDKNEKEKGAASQHDLHGVANTTSAMMRDTNKETRWHVRRPTDSETSLMASEAEEKSSAPVQSGVAMHNAEDSPTARSPHVEGQQEEEVVTVNAEPRSEDNRDKWRELQHILRENSLLVHGDHSPAFIVELDLSGVRFSESEWTLLVEDILSQLSATQVLRLARCELDDRRVIRLLQQGMTKPHSTHNNSSINSDNDRRQWLPVLRVLDLRANVLTYRCLTHLGRWLLWAADTMDHLQLSQNALRDYGFQILAIYLAKFTLSHVESEPALFCPRLVRRVRTRHECSPSAQADDMHIGLAVLELERCGASPRGLSELMAGASRAQRLHTLYIGQNSATILNESTLAVKKSASDMSREAVSTNTSITTLFANFAPLHCPAALRHIALDGVPLSQSCTTAGCRELLLNLFFCCPELTQLGLSAVFDRSHMTEDELKALLHEGNRMLRMNKGSCNTSPARETNGDHHHHQRVYESWQQMQETMQTFTYGPAHALLAGQVRVGDLFAELIAHAALNAVRRARPVPPAFAQLRVLSLNDAGLSDFGACMLCSALTSGRALYGVLSGLQEVQLRNNLLSAQGCVMLIRSLFSLDNSNTNSQEVNGRTMKELWLEGNAGVKSDDMRALEAIAVAAQEALVQRLHHLLEPQRMHGKTSTNVTHTDAAATPMQSPSLPAIGLPSCVPMCIRYGGAAPAPAYLTGCTEDGNTMHSFPHVHTESGDALAEQLRLYLRNAHTTTPAVETTRPSAHASPSPQRNSHARVTHDEEEYKATQGSPTPGASPTHEEHVHLPASHGVSPTHVTLPTKASKEIADQVAEHTVVEGNNNMQINAHLVRSSCDTNEPVVEAVHSKLAIGEGNDSGDRGTHEASSSSPFTLTRVTGNKTQHGIFHHVHSNSTSTNMDDTHRESMQDLPSALEPHPVAPMAALRHEHHTDDDADEDEDETTEDKSNATAAAAVHVTPTHSLPYGPHKEGRMRTILYPYLPTEGHLLHHAMPILCSMEEDGQQARKALEEDLRDLVSGSLPEQNHKDNNPGSSGSRAVDSVGRVTCDTFYDRALQTDLLLITLVTTERRSVLKERLQSSLMAESSSSPVQQQRYFPHLVNYLRQLALSAPQENKPSSASEQQQAAAAVEKREEEVTPEEKIVGVQAGRSLSDPPQPDQPTAVRPKTTVQAAHVAESVEKAAVEPGNTHNGGDIHEEEEAVTENGEGLLAEQDTFEAALRAKTHTLPRHATATPSVGRTKTFVFSFTHRPGTTLCRAWTVLHEASEIGELARGCAEADFTALLQPGPNSERNNNNNTVLEVSVVAGDVSLNTLQLRVRTNERRATIESRLQRIHSTTTNNSNSGVEGSDSQVTSFSPTSLMAAVALPSDGFASLAQLLSESPQYDCLVVLRRYLANTPRRGHTAHYLQQTYRSLDLFLHYCHATPSPLLSRELGFTSLGQLMEDVNALTAKRAADNIEEERNTHVVPEVSENERDRRTYDEYAREGQPTRLGHSMRQSISESNSDYVVQADHYSSSQAPLPSAHQTHLQPSYSTPLEADSYSDSKMTRNNNDAVNMHLSANNSTSHEARAQPAQNTSSAAEEEAVLDDDLADGFYPSSSARGDDVHGAHVSSYQQSHEQEASKAAESIQHEDDNNNYNSSSVVVALDPPLVPRRTTSAHPERVEGSEPAMATAELPIERNAAEAMDSIVSATTTATATATAAMPLVSPSTAASSYVSVRSNARHFGPAMCDLSPLTPQEEEEEQHNNNNNEDEPTADKEEGNNKRLVKSRVAAEAQSAQWAQGDSQGLHASSLSPSPPHSVEVSHSRHNDEIPLLNNNNNNNNNNEDIRSPQMTEERPRAATNTSAQQPIFVTESLEFEGSDTPRQRNVNRQQNEVVRVSRRESNEEAAAVVVVTERPRMAHDSGSTTATAAAAAPPALTAAAHTTDYRHRRVTSGATVSCSSQADAMDNTSTQTPHRSRRGHPSRGVTERTREKVHRHLMQLAFDGMAKGSIALNPKEQQTIRVGKGKWGTQPVLITLEWDVMFALTFEKPSRPFMSKKRACMLVHPLAFGFDCMPESTNHKSELRHNLLIHIRRPYSPETFGIAPSDIESALMHGATLTAPTRTAWPGSAIPNASVTDASSEVSRTSTINTGAGMLVARLLQDNIVLAVTMKSSKQVREAVMILQDGVQRAQKAVNEAVKMAKVARNSARYNSGT